jgi:hypothetical protein
VKIGRGSIYLRGHNLRVNNPSHRKDVQEKHRKIRSGRTLEELGHKPDCGCGPCRAKRGESLKQQGHPSDCNCMCCTNVWPHKSDCQCYCCKAKRGEYLGEGNPAWRGGTSFHPYPVEWNEQLRESIRERDGRVCQMPGCGKTEEENGEKLHIHHIDYDKSNLDEYNLISLCMPCHMTTNGNRRYWKLIFERIGQCLAAAAK